MPRNPVFVQRWYSDARDCKHGSRKRGRALNFLIMKLTPQPRMFRRVACTRLPTKWGIFQAIGFQWEVCNGTRRIETAVALLWGQMTGSAPLVRIHSQCFTGDALGSLRCDCGEQLELAMRAIVREKSGLLIYEHQEGRGIGLMAKLQAYSLQDKGLDTVEANHALGFHTDHRDFALPVAILRDLGVSRVRLLSNNPQKSRTLIDAGIDVVERVPCEIAPNPYSFAYLQAKKEKMGHALSQSGRDSMVAVRHARFDEPARRSKSKSPVRREQSP